MSRLQQGYQAVQQSVSNAVDRIDDAVLEGRKTIAAYMEGEMGNPWIVAGVGAVMSALFVMVVFYLEYVFFNPTTGLIGKNVSSFFVSSHGAFFYLVAWLMITGAAISFGLSYTKNESAIQYTVLAAAIMTMIFFVAIKNLTDQASSASFWIWVALSILGPVLAAIYGWWSLRAMRKKGTVSDAAIKAMSNPDEQKAAKDANDAYNSRYMASTVGLVANIGGAVGTFAGFWVMSPVLTVTA